jgi:uncharacterized membrane protein
MPTPKEFESQITDTYQFMRIGMGALALAFPFVLWLGGKWLIGLPTQTSLSAYYHSDLRDVFVGVLCAIGFCLFLYKGFSKSEDWALNLAGALAVGIAYFPMAAEKVLACLAVCAIDGAECFATSARYDRTLDALLALKGHFLGFQFSVHGTCAVLFFVAIAYVCGFCAKRTLHLIPDEAVRRRYLRTYQLLAVAMVGVPLAVAVLTKLDPTSANGCTDFTVIRIEAAGVCVFAAYWLVKTWEAKKYGADKVYPERRAIPEAKAKTV